MKRLILALPLLALLLVGCGTDNLLGPQDEGRVVVPAEECNPNMQPC